MIQHFTKNKSLDNHNKTLYYSNGNRSIKKSFLQSLHKGFNSFSQIDQSIIDNQNKSKKNTNNNFNTIFNAHRTRKINTMSDFYNNKNSSSKKLYRNSNEANQNYQSQNKTTLLSTTNFQENCPVLADSLFETKNRLQRVKTQVEALRVYQFNQYIKKSLRYQQLLDLNENKKKHLKKLNNKIGEITKKSAVDVVPKNLFYEIKFQKIDIQSWKPQSREGHTCVIYKNMAIIIGGHCSSAFSTAHVYSFEKNSWLKQISTQSARSYHSSLLYKNRFIITFGGMGQYDVSCRSRRCYNSVNLIDLSNFTTRAMKMHNQESIVSRRSHCAALMSKNMIVLGGINARKQHLNDLIYLDLKQLRWYHKQMKIQGKELIQNMQTGIAKHKGIPIFKERKNLPLYSVEYSDYQGIYIFGGIFGNLQQNIVLLLSFNKYTPTLKKIEYSGIPPSSIDPVLQKFNQMILIVSGDQKQRQICLFKHLTKQFIAVNTNAPNLKYLGGIGSTVNKYQDKYYVFFGLGQQGYLGSITNFQIQQKVKERQILKKRKQKSLTNNQMIEWKTKRQNCQSDSQKQFQL